MDFFEVVNKRGSYRDRFEETPIPDDDIRKMLGAAIKAPSGYNMQTTSFVVVTDPQLRNEISALMPSDATKTAPAIIVVTSEHVEADGLCFESKTTHPLPKPCCWQSPPWVTHPYGWTAIQSWTAILKKSRQSSACLKIKP